MTCIKYEQTYLVDLEIIQHNSENIENINQLSNHSISFVDNENSLSAMNNKDLEPLENKFDFLTSLVFTAARLFTLILGIIVHRAFYKLMRRLPGRSINQIIYPYMVIYSLIFQRLSCDHFLHCMHTCCTSRY